MVKSIFIEQEGGTVDLADIDRLTSITSTAGDTLILTSDGTDNILTNSRGDIILQPFSTTTGGLVDFKFTQLATGFPQLETSGDSGNLLIGGASDTTVTLYPGASTRFEATGNVFNILAATGAFKINSTNMILDDDQLTFGGHGANIQQTLTPDQGLLIQSNVASVQPVLQVNTTTTRDLIIASKSGTSVFTVASTGVTKLINAGTEWTTVSSPTNAWRFDTATSMTSGILFGIQNLDNDVLKLTANSGGRIDWVFDTVTSGIGVTYYDFKRNGVSVFNFTDTIINLLDNTVIEMTSTEAFLVRKDSDGGDIFTVDTTNSTVEFGGNAVMGDNSVTGIDTITFTDTAGTIAGIQNQNLLDKTAAESISGIYTFTDANPIDFNAVLDAGIGLDTTTIQIGAAGEINGALLRIINHTGEGIAAFRTYDLDSGKFMSMAVTSTAGVYSTNATSMNFQALAGTSMNFKLGSGSFNINSTGKDANTVIQGDTDTQLFFVDAGNETVTISGNLSTGTFNVAGTIFLTDKLMFSQSDGNEYIDADSNTSVVIGATSQIHFDIGGTEQVIITNGTFQPTTNDDIDLGTTSLLFKDSYFSGFVHRGVSAAITASITQTQAGGFQLLDEINEIATVANAGDTVTLPTAVIGKTCIIINNGANALRIFPGTSDDLGAGVNIVMTTDLAVGDMITFVAYDATNWRGRRGTYVT